MKSVFLCFAKYCIQQLAILRQTAKIQERAMLPIHQTIDYIFWSSYFTTLQSRIKSQTGNIKAKEFPCNKKTRSVVSKNMSSFSSNVLCGGNSNLWDSLILWSTDYFAVTSSVSLLHSLVVLLGISGISIETIHFISCSDQGIYS